MVRVRTENGRQAIDRWNRVFEALSAEPRRQLIGSLIESPADGAVALPESAMNPNVSADPETLERKLYHHHLPMLADRKFIEWTTDPLAASPGARFDDVAVVFEALDSSATEIPDPLVVGWQRLEREQQRQETSDD